MAQKSQRVVFMIYIYELDGILGKKIADGKTIGPISSFGEKLNSTRLKYHQARLFDTQYR
jgi:hypothetical protein